MTKKSRGSKPKHGPGYVCFKNQGTSKAKKVAAKKTTAVIKAGKAKSIAEAQAKLMGRKAAREIRQQQRDYPGRRY